MIINRLLKLVPEKFKSYQYMSQIIPSKYRLQVDKVVKQIKPELFADSDVVEVSSHDESSLNEESSERKRQNLARNLSNDEDSQFPKGYTDKSHEQSLKDHQAQTAFSASSVNGAGNTGGKVNSNMSHRNYQ